MTMIRQALREAILATVDDLDVKPLLTQINHDDMPLSAELTFKWKFDPATILLLRSLDKQYDKIFTR